jgi:hypothetical protein
MAFCVPTSYNDSDGCGEEYKPGVPKNMRPLWQLWRESALAESCNQSPQRLGVDVPMGAAPSPNSINPLRHVLNLVPCGLIVFPVDVDADELAPKLERGFRDTSSPYEWIENCSVLQRESSVYPVKL